MTPVSTHPEALDEFRAATLYYLSQDPLVAAEFVDSYDFAIKSIVQSPSSFPILTGPFRRKLLNKFPFSIFYICSETEIRIVAVAHQSRKPFYWKDRS